MNILLLEDDEALAHRLMDTFRGGDVIRWARKVEYAQEWLTAYRQDLILLDLTIPGCSGLDILRTFAKVRAPKIVLADVSNVYMVKEAAKLGAVDYLVKGTPDDLAIIHDMCERIHFNLSKISRSRFQFPPEIFEQLKAYLWAPRWAELKTAQ